MDRCIETLTKQERQTLSVPGIVLKVFNERFYFDGGVSCGASCLHFFRDIVIKDITCSIWSNFFSLE